MRFASVSSSSFRNIFPEPVNADSGNIILYGENGQGKTNMLEEAYMLSYGSSFRTDRIRECISFGFESFWLMGEWKDEDGRSGTVSFSFDGKNRRIAVDGREIADRKDLVALFPCIVFCHGDLSFVTGEPEKRRRFFDQMISLSEPDYLDELRLYKRILAQRNAALKDGDDSLAVVYDERLASSGLEVMRKRRDITKRFNAVFGDLYKEISGTEEKLWLEYSPSWGEAENEEDALKSLSSSFERDKSQFSTSSGPHRDRFSLFSPSGTFASIGSTGQLRLCSIIFRIVEGILYSSASGRKPMLLVDDVLLEMDHEKRKRLLKNLPPHSQAWYTFLPDEEYGESLSDSISYLVEGGVFSVR